LRPILFDADAFNCVRAMSFLRLLRQAPADATPFVMTQYVARHELHDVQADVAALETEKRLRIEPVSVRKTDPQGRRFREYKDEKLDKGEAESLAWVMGLDAADRPIFITNDRGARAGFVRHGAPVGDVMDLIVEAITSGAVAEAAARDVVAAAWDDRPNHRCRPQDYTDFDATIAKRAATKP
jgi:predicted nucleic acid-binding protein